MSSSQLGAEEKDIANVMQLISGDRVHHFWDGERRVGTAVQPRIEGLDDPAWDVWLLYRPGVTWEPGEAPEPDWWEHQLGDLRNAYPDRRLDAERFARKAVEMSGP